VIPLAAPDAVAAVRRIAFAALLAVLLAVAASIAVALAGIGGGG